MDQFSFMNGNFCEPVSDNITNVGQFSDLEGFGNNDICLPVNNDDQVSEPMPALPSVNGMMGDYMNHGISNNGNDMFCSFTNSNEMPPMPMGNNMNMNSNNAQMNMMPQINNGNNMLDSSTIADTASTTYDKSKSTPPSKSGIKFYSRNDVLCGRGGGTNVHPGNRRFRDLINANRRAYLKARKNDKPAISRSIVRTIREMNGRFLKKDEKLGLWFEIGDDGAREKTSQALRQRAPEMKRILFEDEQRQRNEQLARQQQQAQLMQRSFNCMQQNDQCDGSNMNGNFNSFNQSMNNNFSNNNFSRNSQLMNMASNMMNNDNSDVLNNNDNSGSIYEQYAMLQQKNYFAKSQDVFLKKLAMNGFDPSNFQRQQRDIESMASQTLLSQVMKPITPRGA